MKKNVIIISVIVCILIILTSIGIYIKLKRSENTQATEKSIVEIENVNIEEPKEESTEIQKMEVKEETPKQESKSSNKQPETKTEQVSSKPANKDFLFTDGYTMENVTQAAQDYLKSSGHAGECIPIKDNEGIYLGMRVIFY